MKEIKCLRCQVTMEFKGEEKLQFGETGWILGDLPNLFSGALKVKVYVCPMCGKIEFFEAKEEELLQIKCPKCGMSHDFDYPKCPHCKHFY